MQPLIATITEGLTKQLQLAFFIKMYKCQHCVVQNMHHSSLEAHTFKQITLHMIDKVHFQVIDKIRIYYCETISLNSPNPLRSFLYKKQG